MPEPQPQRYEVVRAEKDTKEVKLDHGTFFNWDLILKLGDERTACTTFAKDTTTYTVDEFVEGYFEEDPKYGTKFKRQRIGSNNGGGFSAAKSPEQQKAIVKQSCLKVAAQTVETAQRLGLLENVKSVSQLAELVDRTADLYVEKVNA